MKKNKSKRSVPDRLEAVVEAAGAVDSAFDPAGSYTGNPVQEGEAPVQDADDL